MTKLQTLTLTDNDLDRAVKIQGTMYDRKRKISSSAMKKMARLLKSGKTVSYVANLFGCSPTTVKYNTDPVYRDLHKSRCSGAHTGKNHVSKLNRVAYKRQLVAAGKVTA